MICQSPNCRHENPADAPYCQQCGRSFPASTPPPPLDTPGPRGRGTEKRRSPILFYIAIWVPILIATVFFVAFC